MKGEIEMEKKKTKQEKGRLMRSRAKVEEDCVLKKMNAKVDIL